MNIKIARNFIVISGQKCKFKLSQYFNSVVDLVVWVKNWQKRFNEEGGLMRHRGLRGKGFKGEGAKLNPIYYIVAYTF